MCERADCSPFHQVSQYQQFKKGFLHLIHSRADFSSKERLAIGDYVVPAR
jgi:hypothetical protein